MNDEDNEVTLGEDANHSIEHEGNGSTKDGSTDDCGRICEVSVKAVNSSSVPGQEASQEICKKLRPVYYIYWISTHESSLNGFSLVG